MTLTLRGEAAEVALGEAQAVRALVQDPDRRERLADLIAAVHEGSLEPTEAQTLEELLELGLACGRIRGRYGPGGEQAALRTYRRLPSGQALAEGAAEVTRALEPLFGRRLDHVDVRAPGPGSFLISVGAEGIELTIRLDRTGARIHSVGV